MQWKTWDPLRGHTLRLDEVISNADDDARVALQLAVVFYEHRLETWAAAVEAIRVASFPSLEPDLPEQPNGLTEEDCVVGIALSDPAFIAELLHQDMSAKAHAALAEKRALLHGKSASGHSVRLSESFARRLAWGRRLGRWPITRWRLLGCLREANSIYYWDDRAHDNYHLKNSPDDYWMKDPPTPYIERGDELTQLDTIMAKARSTFIVGPARSGRLTLALAWLARVRCGDAGRRLDGYWGARYWRSDPPTGRKLIEHHTITTDTDVAALGKKKNRALIIVPTELFAAARAILDPGKKFGVVEMPPGDPMQILPNWLCASQSEPDALERCLAVFGDARMPIEEFPPVPWDVWSRDPLTDDSWYVRNPRKPKDIIVNPLVRKSIESGVWLEPYSGYRERMSPYDLWRPLDRFVPNGDLTALVELAKSISIPVAID